MMSNVSAYRVQMVVFSRSCVVKSHRNNALTQLCFNMQCAAGILEAMCILTSGNMSINEEELRVTLRPSEGVIRYIISGISLSQIL